MQFRIGFSSKFFTLWKVDERRSFEVVDGVNLPFVKRELKFIKNLSFNELEAKRKAIFEGVENFEIDSGLCGKVYLLKQFEGRDLDELFFEYCEFRNEFLKEFLLEKGFKDFNGQLIYPAHFKKIVTLKKLNIFKMKTVKEKIQELTEQISNLEKMRADLKYERIVECQFEIGEKVRVYSEVRFRYNEEKQRVFEGFGYVKRISVKDDGDFSFTLKKAKKDGSESSFGFGDFGSLKVEKF